MGLIVDGEMMRWVEFEERSWGRLNNNEGREVVCWLFRLEKKIERDELICYVIVVKLYFTVVDLSGR